MESTRRRSSSWWLAAILAAGVAGLIAYGVAAGDRAYAAVGSSYPGVVTSAAEPVGYLLTTLAGSIVLGGLVLVVVTARPNPDNVIDEKSFTAHLLVERFAAAWAALAVAMVLIQAASDAGMSVSSALRATALVPAVTASEQARAWIVVAVAAVVVAAAVRLSVRWITHVLVVVPALVGVLAIPVTGNAGQGPDHDYATGAAIVGAIALAVFAGVKIVAALTPAAPTSAHRILLAQNISGAVALGYGILLFALLVGPGNPLQTSYGRAGVAAAGVLALTLIADVLHQISGRRRTVVLSPARRWAGAAAAVAVLALVALMATQPAPRLLTHEFTTWDVFLGYALPEPVSASTLLTVWRFDVLIGAGALVLALGYVLGYLRLRRRGDTWPPGRLVAWLAGCLLLTFTSGSGLKAYGSAMFSVHMAEHMILNMFVPVLLVLGGPVTLALRALPPADDGAAPGPREWLLKLVHSRVTAFLSHPVIAFVLFVGSPYVVYFTPLFDSLAPYHWGHELMSVHFVIVGYLYYWGIIGIDPGPRRLPFLGRLGMLFAVMPFHAFFGIATMTMNTIIGEQFYRSVGLPWLGDLQADQSLGGAIAWGSSEVPVIIVVIALVTQWARQDRRAAARADRHADSGFDDDLDAYNAMLRELERGRR